MQVTIELTSDEGERLRSIAQPLGITPERLAHALLVDTLTGPDDEFLRAAEHVLRKNQQLYERLS